jgi:hypothetical protein
MSTGPLHLISDYRKSPPPPTDGSESKLEAELKEKYRVIISSPFTRYPAYATCKLLTTATTSVQDLQVFASKHNLLLKPFTGSNEYNYTLSKPLQPTGGKWEKALELVLAIVLGLALSLFFYTKVEQPPSSVPIPIPTVESVYDYFGWSW